MGVSRADNSLAIPNRSLQYQCTYRLVKIHWCLPKLSSGIEIWTDGCMTDERTDGHNDIQCETIIPATIVWRCIKIYRLYNIEQLPFWIIFLHNLNIVVGYKAVYLLFFFCCCFLFLVFDLSNIIIRGCGVFVCFSYRKMLKKYMQTFENNYPVQNFSISIQNLAQSQTMQHWALTLKN